MPYDLNVSVAPSLPYSGEFNAPANGTYYFLFDNTIGASWSNYLGQNSTGPTDGQFSLSTVQSVKTDSINWGVTGSGSCDHNWRWSVCDRDVGFEKQIEVLVMALSESISFLRNGMRDVFNTKIGVCDFDCSFRAAVSKNVRIHAVR